jgi:DNA polymerase-1
MSFFIEENTTKKQKNKVSKKICAKYSCMVCDLKHKEKRKPVGSDVPIIYILEESTKKTRSETLTLLKKVFGTDFVVNNVRFNYITLCKPINEETEQELICCKKNIITDIEKSNPKLILTFSDKPVNWLLPEGDAEMWYGKKMPLAVGKTDVWYMALLHGKKYDDTSIRKLNELRDFILHDYTKPKVIRNGYTDGVTYVTGKEPNAIHTIIENLKYFEKQPVTAVDIETIRGLFPYYLKAKLYTIGISDGKRHFAFPYDVPGLWSEAEFSTLKNAVRNFLLNSKLKVAHNLKFDLQWFCFLFGEDVMRKTAWTDTMVQAFLINGKVSDPNKKKNPNKGALKLNTLCIQYLGFALKNQNDVDVSDLEKYPIHDTLLYNGMDSKYTIMLYHIQNELMSIKNKRVLDLHIETAKSLILMELLGFPINKEKLLEISKDLEKKISKLNNGINNLPEVIEFEKRNNKKFNPNSGDHLLDIFTRDKSIKLIKKTEKGTKFSTDKTVIGNLCEQGNKLAQYYSEYGILSDLKSKYVDAYFDKLDCIGRLHTTFHDIGTRTGRLSSSNPNMQNIPKRKNSYVRSVFVPPKGYTIVPIDYGQLEARVLVMASGEWNIIQSDVHRTWAINVATAFPKAAGIEHVDELLNDEKALKKFRAGIKNSVVFPWFYLAGMTSVGKALGIINRKTKPETLQNDPGYLIIRSLYNKFWKDFAKVKVWQNSTKNIYNTKGYVETLTGRKRLGPLDYTAICNSPVQGTASDIVLGAMNRLSKTSYEENIPFLQCILNIHDDLTFLIPDSELDTAIPYIAKEMVRDYPFMNKVPLEVEVSIGKNWYEMKDYKKYTLADFN